MSGDLINAKEAWISIGSKMYLNVNALISSDAFTALLASTPKITIKNVTTSSTKEQHDFEDGVKQIIIRSEKVTEIKYNFDEADFDAGKKATITSGGFLKLSGLNFSGKSIFFETDKNNIDVEILELY